VLYLDPSISEGLRLALNTAIQVVTKFKPGTLVASANCDSSRIHIVDSVNWSSRDTIALTLNGGA
jgi:hypothetical protein